MSERPRNRPPSDRPPSRRVSTGGPPPARAGRPTRNVNAPRRSDPFPIVLGAIIAALIIGRMVVVYLISSNNGGGTSGTSGTGGTANGGNAGGGQPTTAAGVTDLTPAAGGQDNVTPEGTPAPTEEPAPRMTLE